MEQIEGAVNVIDPKTIPKDHPEILGMITTYYPGVIVDVKFQREGEMVNVFTRESPDSEEFTCESSLWKKIATFPFPSSRRLELQYDAELSDYSVITCPTPEITIEQL